MSLETQWDTYAIPTTTTTNDLRPFREFGFDKDVLPILRTTLGEGHERESQRSLWQAALQEEEMFGGGALGCEVMFKFEINDENGC